MRSVQTSRRWRLCTKYERGYCTWFSLYEMTIADTKTNLPWWDCLFQLENAFSRPPFFPRKPCGRRVIFEYCHCNREKQQEVRGVVRIWRLYCSMLRFLGFRFGFIPFGWPMRHLYWFTRQYWNWSTNRRIDQSIGIGQLVDWFTN